MEKTKENLKVNTQHTGEPHCWLTDWEPGWIASVTVQNDLPLMYPISPQPGMCSEPPHVNT